MRQFDTQAPLAVTIWPRARFRYDLLISDSHMSALGQKQTCAAQKGMSALPPESGRNSGHRISVKGRALLCPVRSNVDLLRYGEGIVHITADEISHSALYLSVTKQKLDGADIPGVALTGHASCKAMSAFTVAIRGKADMPLCTAHVRSWAKADITMPVDVSVLRYPQQRGV